MSKKDYQKSEQLKSFILKNFHLLQGKGTSSSTLEFPDFELYPRDFLNFADYELKQLSKSDESKKEIHLINCISHLKRAIDCELDMCLHILNLYSIFDQKNLGFPTKLIFFKQAGLFNSRTLERFNHMRNQMEHYYRIPKIEDIEVYFDFVTALIGILDSSILSMPERMYLNLDTGREKREDASKRLSIELNYIKEPNVKITVELVNHPEDTFKLEVGATDKDNFPYFLKIFLLLDKKSSFAREKFVLDILNEISS